LIGGVGKIVTAGGIFAPLLTTADAAGFKIGFM